MSDEYTIVDFTRDAKRFGERFADRRLRLHAWSSPEDIGQDAAVLAMLAFRRGREPSERLARVIGWIACLRFIQYAKSSRRDWASVFVADLCREPEHPAPRLDVVDFVHWFMRDVPLDHREIISLAARGLRYSDIAAARGFRSATGPQRVIATYGIERIAPAGGTRTKPGSRRDLRRARAVALR